MNIKELTSSIEHISTQLPNINSFYSDDVYNVWNNKEVKYASTVFLVQAANVIGTTTEVTATLYYGDRLFEDESNKKDIYDDAINYITVIINELKKQGNPISIDDYTVNLFTQEFDDLLAGGYADLVIKFPNTIGICGFNGKISEGEMRNVFIDENGEYNIRKTPGVNFLGVNLEVRVPGRIDLAQLGCPQWQDDAYNKEMNDGIAYALEFQKNWTNPEKCYQISTGDYKFKYFPEVDMSNCDDASLMFYNSPQLEVVAKLDLSRCTKLDHLFATCPELTYIPKELDISNCTTMYNAFSGCYKLKNVPRNMDFSKVTNMYGCFNSCKYLENLPDLLDLRNCTTLHSAFTGCRFVHNFNIINTEKVKDWYGCFSGCSNLIGLPNLRTDSLEGDVYTMFHQCYKLENLPIINTNKVTKCSYMFGACLKLKTIKLTSLANATFLANMFYQCYALENVEFDEWKQMDIDLSPAPNLTIHSINYIIEHALNGTTRKLKLHKEAYDRWKASAEYDKYSKLAATKGITITK